MDLTSHLSELFKVLVLALLQGVTELFPVSSLGHTLLLPALFGWGTIITQDTFLPTVVLLHLGTVVALLAFFWRDWVALIAAFFKTATAGRLDAHPQGRTIWLVLVATIPVGLLGLFLKEVVRSVFFSSAWPVLPAAFLCLNGAILFAGEILRRRSEPEGVGRFKQEESFLQIADLTFIQAFFIGLVQAAALVPGISRSGITMVAGMRARLSHEEAARFSFLLATPVILAAGVAEVPTLFKSSTSTLMIALIGGVVAGVAAFLSVKFLMRYFERGRLTPFAIYCLVAGLISFLIFAPVSMGVFKLPW